LKVTISDGNGRSVEIGKSEKDKGAKKPKPEKYEHVPADDLAWRLLEDVRRLSHSTLEAARIALVWENRVLADRDGHLVLGRARKTSKVDRLFREHDFTILLNKATWAEFPEPIRRALLDHELCHCGARTTGKGETVYYVRKHDLEDFHEVVRRHGIWTNNLKAFIEAALGREQLDIFNPKGRKLTCEAKAFEVRA
jgi:hypothetical protein